MSSNVKFEKPVKFEAEEAFSFGVTNGKFGGYSVPIKLPQDGPNMALLRSTAEQNGATLRLYGGDSDTVYFLCDQLTDRQKTDLLGQKIMIVHIKFEATGTYKRRDGSVELRLVVTKLQKVRVAERILAPAPED